MRKTVTSGLLLGIMASSAISSSVALAKTEIKYFFWASATELKLRQQMITMFEKANPDIKVKAINCEPGVFDTKLISMVAAGMAPDVVNMCNDWHGKRNPLWMPLNSFIQKDKVWKAEDFFPVTVNTMGKKGSIYAVPYIVKSAVVFYNADLVSQLGLQIPTDEWTWDDLLAISIKGTSGTGSTKRYGLSGIADIHAAWSLGGELFNEDMTKCIASNPKVEKGLQFALDLIYRYGAMPNIRSGDTGRVTSGKSPLGQGYSWDIMGIQQAVKKKFNWDIVGLPKDAEGHRAADVRVDGLAMMRNAKNKDACWRFMKFFSSNRAVQDFVGVQEGIPPLKSAANSETFFSSFPGGQSYNRKVLANALTYGKTQPFGGYFQPIAEVWNKEMDKAYSQKQSIAEALKRIETQANAIFSTPGRLH